MTHGIRRLIVICSLVVVVACSSHPSNDGGTVDGGKSPPDAGFPADGGLTDAGLSDGGVTPIDAGMPPADGGTPLDGGPAPADAGDAGNSTIDGGMPPDGGIPADAGPPPCGVMGQACCAADTCSSGLICSGGACLLTDVNYTLWPIPQDAPVETAATVSADGTSVLDGVTGLSWQRQVFPNPCPGDGADAGPSGVCTWQDAQTYCGSLNALAPDGISSGWRAPSVVELLSIVNFTDGSPAVDTALFPDTPPAPFWTATIDAADATQAWSVDFSDGLNAPQPVETASYVRCVSSSPPTVSNPSRCGVEGAVCCYGNSCGVDLTCTGDTCIIDSNYSQSVVPPDTPPQPDYTVSTDGTNVLDGVTGLRWQRQVFPAPCGTDAGTCSWQGAQTYCASLNAIALGDISTGWRAPSVTELISIVNFTEGSAPWIDTSLFPGTPPVPFWASTTEAADTTQAWFVNFGNGLNATQPLATASNVRCVTASSPAPTTDGGPPSCGLEGEPCCDLESCAENLLCTGDVCLVDSNYVQSPAPADAPPESDYAISADGTNVLDSVTGLYWQRQVFPAACDTDGGTCPWTGAAEYCASLNTIALGGISSGWRVPSVVELISMVNYTEDDTQNGPPSGGPALDTSMFPGTPAAPFWASTIDASDPTQAWLVNFSDGLNSVQPITTDSYVRCVSASPPSWAPGDAGTPGDAGPPNDAGPACGLEGHACCNGNSCADDLVCTSGTCLVDCNYTQTPVPADAPPESEYEFPDGGPGVTDGTTAYDSITGLVWQRGLLANPCPADGDGGCTWAHAVSYCDSLNALALGGYSEGWRVPSVVELISITNYTENNGSGSGPPAIDTALFPDTPPVPFWASTVDASNTTQAWTLNFLNGLNAPAPVATVNAVRCVNAPLPETPQVSENCGRLNEACCYASSCGLELICEESTNLCIVDIDYVQTPVPPDAPPEPEYSVSSDGTTVTDAVTRRVWQRDVFPDPCPADGAGICTWPDAVAYCLSLNALPLGGYIGWRLPSVFELMSLVNYTEDTYAGEGTPVGPALDTSPFPGTPATSFWAATPNAADSAQAWSVDFANGLNAPAPVDGGLPVRCVSAPPLTPGVDGGLGTVVSPDGGPANCGHADQPCCYSNGCGPNLICSDSSCIVDGDFFQTPVPTDAPPESANGTTAAIGYSVAADGTTVTDLVTQLVWQRQAYEYPCLSDGLGVCTWEDAASYCASLDTLQFGGYAAGWRLPDVVELISTVNYTEGSAPTIDPAPFPNTPVEAFWSATSDAENPAQAWTLDFSSGLNRPQPIASLEGVRCVLGPFVAANDVNQQCGVLDEPCCYADSCGPALLCSNGACIIDANYARWTVPPDTTPSSSTQYTLSAGSSTTTDTTTGLVWSTAPVGNPCPNDGAGACTALDAAAFCTALGPGWRLPSVVELLSIVDFGSSTEPLVDITAFPNITAASPAAWSSTAAADGSARSWTVSFSNGLDSLVTNSTPLTPLCVNSGG